MSNVCLACTKRGKTWTGSDPVCSFPNGGEFSSDGWNCATANEIRDICEKNAVYCEDQYYSTIKVDEVELPSGEALALWVSWYKHRGRTDAMWILSESSPPRKPTEADCREIILARLTDGGERL